MSDLIISVTGPGMLDDPRIHMVLCQHHEEYVKYRQLKKLPGTKCQRLRMEHQLIGIHNPINTKIILLSGYKGTHLWRTGAVGRFIERNNRTGLPQSPVEEFIFPIWN